MPEEQNLFGSSKNGTYLSNYIKAPMIMSVVTSLVLVYSTSCWKKGCKKILTVSMEFQAPTCVLFATQIYIDVYFFFYTYMLT